MNLSDAEKNKPDKCQECGAKKPNILTGYSTCHSCPLYICTVCTAKVLVK